MGVSWVLLYDSLGYVYFFSLWRHGYRMSTALQLEFCSASNNSSRGYYVFIFQARLEMVFYIYTGATHHMTSNLAAFVSSSPYQGKSVVFTGDHTPLSISDIGTISLSSRSGNVPHLNDAMLLPKVSLSKDLIGWTTFWWSPKLCHLYSDFLCVVKDLHTHNVIAIGCRP